MAGRPFRYPASPILAEDTCVQPCWHQSCYHCHQVIEMQVRERITITTFRA
jgi:hypothetical protein